MDTGCVICYESHDAVDCKERTKQHCPECHALIQCKSDHTSVCASKNWIFNAYAKLYAKPLTERMIISTSSPFRYLYKTCWRKSEDELEMFSPSNGAFIQFKSDRDISLSTTCFESVQIVVVVKQKQKNTFSIPTGLLAESAQNC